MNRLRRKIDNFFRKLEGRFRSLLFFLLILSLFLVFQYKWQNPGMTPLMPIRFVGDIVDGKFILPRHFRVPIQQISNNMIYGVIAGEDQRFLDHRGVDLQALREAFQKDVRSQSFDVWWSTITQQTAKNLFLWPNRSFFRKAVEFYFALMMELLRSKERIMEVYLNIIEFWDGIYGVEQAAQYYFHTSAAKLTQSQASFLVAIMPNPRYYQLHKYSYLITTRKTIISGMMSNIKRNKEIKAFVEKTKD